MFELAKKAIWARQDAKAQRWIFRQDEQDAQDIFTGQTFDGFIPAFNGTARKPTKKIYLVNPACPVECKAHSSGVDPVKKQIILCKSVVK